MKGKTDIKIFNDNTQLNLRNCTGVNFGNIGNEDAEIKPFGLILKPQQEFTIPFTNVIKDFDIEIICNDKIVVTYETVNCK